MDPADYFEDEEEPMEIEGGLGPEAELASATEVAGGEVGGGVLSQVGGTIVPVLEKAVVGALARAVRTELGKLLVSKFITFKFLKMFK